VQHALATREKKTNARDAGSILQQKENRVLIAGSLIVTCWQKQIQNSVMIAKNFLVPD
jgi:hypothetical protein